MKSVRFSQGTQISLANKPPLKKILAENTKWCILDTFDFPNKKSRTSHA
jgi:hypothetical protein